jgi:hypothetical protein
MTILRNGLYLTIILLLTCVATAHVQFQVIQGEEIERFLREAEIVGAKTLDVGITAPKKLTMARNGETRYAVFKTVDEYKNMMKFADGRVDVNFQDTWMSEIAAYEIDKIMGLGMVPSTVERTYRGQKGSVQFWVDSMMSELEHRAKKITSPEPENFNREMFKARLFDNLLYNTDRNLQNLLITKEWELILIDHSRAFRPQTFLKSPKDLERFSLSVLEGLRKLNEKNLTEKAGKYLPKNQIQGVLKRRDAILELAKKLEAEKGAAAVYYP